MKRRVVITGLGCVTPLGHSVDETWQNILEGKSGIEKTTIFDASTYPTTFSAEVKNFDLKNFLDEHEYQNHKAASRNAAFALAAAIQAWKDAKLNEANNIDKEKIGVYLGAGEGPLDFWPCVEIAIKSWDNEKKQLDTLKWATLAYEKLSATNEREQEANMSASHIAKLFDLRGPNFDCLTACAASTQAIGQATELIRTGQADIIISGGAHSMIHPFGVTGFNRLTALSTRNDEPQTASRPFDRTRDGFVIAEGAGIIILESEESAKARNANILAEIIGFGSTADAFRITDIHETGRGGTSAMKLALKDAGITESDIDYISAHGTATTENDKIETLAVKNAFGELAYKIPISSIKSMLGHLIAAAGAVEAIACILAIRDQILPPTINYREPDPECDLDYVPNEPRKAKVKTCLSNSFGFGGQNDTIIIKAYEG